MFDIPLRREEDDMEQSQVMPLLPASGQVIGTLVRRLGIYHPKLRSKTARRYFSGRLEDRIKDSSRDEILGAVAEVLAGLGINAAPPEAYQDEERLLTLKATLAWHATNWDQLRSFLRTRMVQIHPDHLPVVRGVYLRLAVIDLAVRVSAHLHLVGSSPTSLEMLDWVCDAHRGAFLNRQRQQAGLSLERLAETVEVTNNTVDGWMYGDVRPSDDNIITIARMLAVKNPLMEESSVIRELRTLYWLSDIATLLAERIGADAFNKAVLRLRLYAEQAYQAIDELLPVGDHQSNLTELVNLGVRSRYAGRLLSSLAVHESDDEWVEDLEAAGSDWVSRVLMVNLQVFHEEEDELIRKTRGRILEERGIKNPDAHVHYRNSLELRAQGKLDEAYTEVVRATELDPTDPVSRFTLGSVKGRNGVRTGNTAQVQEGMADLWVAATLAPEWLEPWTEISLLLLESGRSREALEHLLNVSPERGELDAGYHRAVGEALRWQGQFSEARAAYETALELDPEDFTTVALAAATALLAGDGNRSRHHARVARHLGASEEIYPLLELLRANWELDPSSDISGEVRRELPAMDAQIRSNPQNVDARLTRARGRMILNQSAPALEDLDAVLRMDPNHGTAYEMRGRLHNYAGRWNAAISDMSEAIRIDPGDGQAHYGRGVALAELGKFDEAIADLTESIRVDPSSADAYRLRGDCHRHQLEPQLALADYDAALVLDPGNVHSRVGRGLVHRKFGDFGQEIADYDAALDADPENALAYRLRGEAHIAAWMLERAVSDFDAALRLTPDDPDIYLGRGNAQLFGGNPEEAITDLETALRLDAANAVAYHSRGIARTVTGDLMGAEEDFRRARELGFDPQVRGE